MRRPTTPGTRRSLGAVVGLFSLTFLVASAGAVPSPAAAARGGAIILRGQPAWSTLGGDISFRLAIRADQPGLEVRAVVHSAVLSRIAFERTLTGDRLGSVLATRSTPLDEMAVVGTDRVLTLGLQDPSATREESRVRLTIPGSGSSGVFPVEIELREPSSGRVVDSFVTDIVAIQPRTENEAPNEPLQVAWVWHFAASPATTPNGETAASFTQAVQANGSLGRIAAGLGQTGGVPITLVPNPETVDALRAASPTSAPAGTVLDALRTASTTSPVLASPYTTIDGPAVLEANLGPAYSAEIERGRRTLEAGLDAAVDATIAPNQPLDSATLTALRATRLLVTPEALTPATAFDQFTPARPFVVDTAAGPFDALEVNPTATELLVQRGPAALRAQQLLAGLSVIALEQPNRTRGVVVDTPLVWDPDPRRVSAVLAGLRDHPLLQGAPLVDLFSIPAAATSRAPYTRALAPITPAAAPVTAFSYANSLRQIDALAGMIGVEDPLVVDLRHELSLTLAGRVPATGRVISRARLQAIEEQVQAVTGGVTTPASRTVTLTSRRASVPLSIENSTGRIVEVAVKLESQKLEFPNGATRRIRLGPGNTTKNFDVAARASGTFPVLVTLSSPDNGIQLQRARYTVRSSAVNGVGLVLTLGAGLFLGLWWLTHWRRSRRPPPPLPTPAPSS